METGETRTAKGILGDYFVQTRLVILFFSTLKLIRFDFEVPGAFAVGHLRLEGARGSNGR